MSLPANLFYGTGIPACIMIIDKENTDEREGVFIIDASRGFKKDGNKNRLREQDIEKIVRTFTTGEEIPGYSGLVKYTDILENNGGNLNVPRYIQKIDDTLPQNIAAHLKGGIPGTDIESLKRLWDISPELKQEIFTCIDTKHDIYNLALPSGEIEGVIGADAKIVAEKAKEAETIFSTWRAAVKDMLLGINADTNPKELIRTIAMMLLKQYEQARLLDNYDVYDCLLNYWNAKLQDDVYLIKAGGYEAGREIEYEYAQKKAKDENGEEIKVDDKTKVKSFDGVLIPRHIIEAEYFAEELDAINKLMEKSDKLETELDELREEESGDDGLLKDVLNEKGDGIPKANLNKRLKELEGKKTSAVLDAMNKLVSLFDKGKTDEMAKLLVEMPELEDYDLKNKGGAFGKTKLKAALKSAAETAVVPEIYREEYDALTAYAAKTAEREDTDKAWKAAQKELDEKAEAKYGELTVDEIKYLLFDAKWMTRLEDDICNEIEQVLNKLSSKVLLIAKRYEHTLGEIEERTEKSRMAVASALERMGYKW